MKINWIKHIERYASVIKNDGDVLVLQPGVDRSALQSLEHELEIILPDEFLDLYMCTNGIGISDRGGVWWFLVPLERIPELINRHKILMNSECSRELLDAALDYVPFFLWTCGDTAGLMKSSCLERKKKCEMWSFEHEELDGGGGEEEFIFLVDNSIRGFLTPVGDHDQKKEYPRPNQSNP